MSFDPQALARYVLSRRTSDGGHFTWGFVFPLGAFTVLTVDLARASGLPWFKWVGAALFVLLCPFWLFVAGWAVLAMRPAKPGGARSDRTSPRPDR